MNLRKWILSGSLLIIAATFTACGGKSTIVYGGGPPAVHFTATRRTIRTTALALP